MIAYTRPNFKGVALRFRFDQLAQGLGMPAINKYGFRKWTSAADHTLSGLPRLSLIGLQMKTLCIKCKWDIVSISHYLMRH